jgi:hypothetical protein
MGPCAFFSESFISFIKIKRNERTFISINAVKCSSIAIK